MKKALAVLTALISSAAIAQTTMTDEQLNAARGICFSHSTIPSKLNPTGYAKGSEWEKTCPAVEQEGQIRDNKRNAVDKAARDKNDLNSLRGMVKK